MGNILEGEEQKKKKKTKEATKVKNLKRIHLKS